MDEIHIRADMTWICVSGVAMQASLHPVLKFLSLLPILLILTGCIFGSDSKKESPYKEVFVNSDDPTLSTEIGGVYYANMCASCHGKDGKGSDTAPSLHACNSCQSGLSTLSKRIQYSMPFDDPGACGDECANFTAQYVLINFNNVEPEVLVREITGESSQDDFTTSSLFIAGEALYQEKCASCHGAQGTGGSGGPSLISCASCNSGNAALVEKITQTMPLNNAASCDENCATDIAAYILGDLNADQDANSVTFLSKANILNAKQTLRKASLSLVGRLPTETEVQQVEDSDLSGLDDVLDTMMSEEAFYQRLSEIFNDTLHQDKYLPGEEAINLLTSGDHPNRRWYRDLGLCTSTCDTPELEAQRERFYRLLNESNDALAQEVYYLINHVVRNNLPISEILTADYTIANYYSARVYSAEDQHEFTKLAAGDENFPEDTQILNDGLFTEDPKDLRPIQVKDIPHAGILTSPMFLNRFPTTATNRNRHRSRMVHKIFLDTDILAIGGTRPDAAAAIASATPTLDDPMCTGCHAVMDPVASTFQNWDSRGRYRPSRLFDGWYTDMLQRGFNGVEMPLANNVDSSLQWLAQQIVSDPRFARAIVKILYEGLSGQNVLPESNPAYSAQRAFLASVEKVLVENNMQIQAAIKALIKSEWWRADGLADTETEAEYENFGAVRLLTPEMLDRKITATLGRQWTASGRNRLTSTRSDSFRILYGGIDSDSITKRITDPNGLMVAVQKRMASELSCQVVPADFVRAKESRLLFPHVEIGQLPSNPAYEQDIKNNIVYLHERLLGETLAVDDAKIQESYQFLSEINFLGLADIAEDNSWQNTNLDWACAARVHPDTGEDLAEADRISADGQYIIRSWMALVNVLLSDPKFLYE